MKLSPTTLSKAEKSTDPIVKELLEFYRFVSGNTAYDAYVIRKRYELKWNKELEEKDVDLINTGKNADIHDKAVDRSMKLFDGQLKFLNDTEAIRKMLLPEDEEKIKTDKRISQSIDLAFS